MIIPCCNTDDTNAESVTPSMNRTTVTLGYLPAIKTTMYVTSYYQYFCKM